MSESGQVEERADLKKGNLIYLNVLLINPLQYIRFVYIVSLFISIQMYV